MGGSGGQCKQAAAAQITGSDVTRRNDTDLSVTHSFRRAQRTHGESKQTHSRGGNGKQKAGIVWQWHICVPGGMSEDPLLQEVILSKRWRGRSSAEKPRVVFHDTRVPLLWDHTYLCWFSTWWDLNYPVFCADMHCCQFRLIQGFIEQEMAACQWSPQLMQWRVARVFVII